MKIAVVGTGLLGLALTYHIQSMLPAAELTLIDKEPLKTGASHIAAGMVHTLVGHEGKRHPLGDEALSSALDLIKTVEAYTGSELYRAGLFRLPRDDRFIESLKKSDPQAWLSKDEVYAKSKGAIIGEGLWIMRGGQLLVQEYLMGLLDLVVSQGAILKKAEVKAVGDLADFDMSALALGAGFQFFEHEALTKLSYKLGQLAILQTKAPPFPVIGRAYLAKANENAIAVGGTYEEVSKGPQLKEIQKLIEYASSFYPGLQEAELLECPYAIRAYGPNKQPFCKELQKGIWALGGVGSRGILLHSYLAKSLASQVCQRALEG